MNRSQRRGLLAAFLLAPLAPLCAWARPSNDEAAIRGLLMKAFDKPEARLVVAPVVVRGRYALAGWTQGPRGGRALLVRPEGGAWDISVCGGDNLLATDTLTLTGLAAAEAQALAQSMRQAEAGLPAATRARFASFDGLVRMGSGQHPTGHSHPASAAAPHAHHGAKP
jgi:hypothetical protein